MKLSLTYADLLWIEDLLLDSLWKMRRAAGRGDRIEPLIAQSQETLERVRKGIESHDGGSEPGG